MQNLIKDLVNNYTVSELEILAKYHGVDSVTKIAAANLNMYQRSEMPCGEKYPCEGLSKKKCRENIHMCYWDQEYDRCTLD